MRSTPNVGSESLFLLTSQLFDFTHSDPEQPWHTHSVFASFLDFFSAANCTLAGMHAFRSMDALLAMALMDDGEG